MCMQTVCTRPILGGKGLGMRLDLTRLLPPIRVGTLFISVVPYSNTKPLKKPQITMERWSTLNHMVVGNPACGIRMGNDLTTVIWLPITPHRLTDMADC